MGVVNGNFNYYVQLALNSSITFHSRNGQNINVNYNLWGPGTTNICANTTFNGPIGCAPSQNAIQGLPVIRYQGNALYNGRFFMKKLHKIIAEVTEDSFLFLLFFVLFLNLCE